MSLLSDRIAALKAILKERIKQALQDVADLRAESDEVRSQFDAGAGSGNDTAEAAELDSLLAALDPTKDAVLPTTSETQSIRARKGKERLGSAAHANAEEEEGKKDKESGAKGH